MNRPTVHDLDGSRGRQKPRLLFVGSFVTEHREQGGLNVQCRRLVDSWLAERLEFLLLDSTPPYLPPPPLVIKASFGLRRLLRLIVILVARRPDAALIYSSGGLSFLEKGVMVLLCRAAGIPVIWSVRSGIFREQIARSAAFAGVARLLLRRATRVLCQSATWQQFFETTTGLRDRDLFVMPNAITPGPLWQLPVARSESRPLRLLFVGHIKRAKGVFELVDALTLFPKTRGIVADVVGYAEAFEELKEYIHSRGAANRIRLHGWQTGEDLVSRFAEADVFVLPTYAEGFPNVLLEAMAAALPVISTPVGAIPDLIVHEVNGLLVPPRDASALADAIALLNEDAGARKRMGEENRRAVAAYSVDAAAARLWRQLAEIAPAFKYVDVTESLSASGVAT